MAAVENVRDNGDCLTLVISQLSRIPLVQNSTFSLGDAGSTAQLYVCLRLRFRCPSTTPISSLVVPSPPPTRLRDIVGEEGARAGLACSFFPSPFQRFCLSVAGCIESYFITGSGTDVNCMIRTFKH